MIFNLHALSIEKQIINSIKNITNQYKEIKFTTNISDNLLLMEIGISISFKKGNPKEVILSISNEREEIDGRFIICLNYWLPLCIEATRKSHSSLNLTFNICDSGGLNALSMDSHDPNQIIPNEYSMRNYYKNRYTKNPYNLKKFQRKWLKRKAILFWRGSTTGGFILNTTNDLYKLKRVKLCQLYNNNNTLNLKISKIVQNKLPKQIFIDELKKQNLWARPVIENKFSSYCFYPDIPGNALAWGSIRKYLMGNLIFKPYTQRKLYYYRFMKPWKHFIPVEEDFSDIHEKYKWAISHIEDASFIAWNGYIKANNYIRTLPEIFIKIVIEKNKNNLKNL